jgi:hypothetical protein
MKTENTLLLKNILTFLKNPSTTKLLTLNKLTPRLILTLISWSYAITFSLGFIIVTLVNALHYSSEHAVQNLIENNSLLSVLFLGAILAPITEELAFRLALIPKPLFIAISTALTARFLVKSSLILTAIPDTLFLTLILPLIILVITYSTVKKPTIWPSILNIYRDHYRIIFYALTILFGIIHIFNFSQINPAYTLILTLPQVIVGLLLGYIRVQYAVKYSMILHGIYNGLLLIPVSIFLQKGAIETNQILILTVALLFILFCYGTLSLLANAIKLKSSQE